jgi:hypothetical protein
VPPRVRLKIPWRYAKVPIVAGEEVRCYSPCQHHPPCSMFRPDHLVNLTVALTLDDPAQKLFGSYICTAAKRCSAPSKLKSISFSCHVYPTIRGSRCPIVYNYWGTVLFKMRSFDARPELASTQTQSLLELGRFLQAFGTSTRVNVSMWWNHMVIAFDGWAICLSVRELHSTPRE